MTSNLESLTSEALALSPIERAMLTRRICESIEGLSDADPVLVAKMAQLHAEIDARLPSLQAMELIKRGLCNNIEQEKS